jgi:hypothetical protein
MTAQAFPEHRPGSCAGAGAGDLEDLGEAEFDPADIDRLRDRDQVGTPDADQPLPLPHRLSGARAAFFSTRRRDQHPPSRLNASARGSPPRPIPPPARATRPAETSDGSSP